MGGADRHVPRARRRGRQRRRLPGGGAQQERHRRGPVFAHAGGDIGASHSWRAGLSYLRARSTAETRRRGGHGARFPASRLTIADFVWKYAPHGNATRDQLQAAGRVLLAQGDGLSLRQRRRARPHHPRGTARQSGWYLQGVYQFMPHVARGRALRPARHRQRRHGVNGVYLAPALHRRRTRVMVDYTPSEFSRVRLQFAASKLGPASPTTSVRAVHPEPGAHGAHKY